MLLILLVECAVLMVTARRLSRLREPERQQALVAETAAAVHLPLPSAYEAHVTGRLLRGERSVVLGQALLLLVAIPVLAAVTTQSTSRHPSALPPTFLVIIAIGVVSRPLALAALMAWDVFARRHRGGPRVARLSRPGLADYVTPYTTWTARVLAAVALPAAALLVWLGQDARLNHPTASRSELVAAIAGGILGLAAVELIARAVVTLPQPAASPIELTWDDALRGVQLDQLYTALTLLCLVIGTFLLTVLEGGGIAWWGLLAGLILFNLGGEPAARYRRRLWPSPEPTVIS